MFLGQVMKHIFQFEMEDNTSYMNNCINFSDFFFSLKLKHEHGYCKCKICMHTEAKIYFLSKLN